MSRRALFVLALALAGCGGHHGGGAATTAPKGAVKLVPFDAALPASLTSRPSTPAPACRAGDLKVAGEMQFVPGTQAGGTGTIAIRNAGSQACRLTGRPTVRFVGGTAPPAQKQQAAQPSPLVFPKVAPPDQALLALAPGQGAVLTVDWQNWCPRVSDATKQSAKLQPPKAMRVTLPQGGGSLSVGYNAIVSCDHAGKPSLIGVHPFAPEPVTASGGFTNTPMTATAHPLDGGSGTLRARRGQVLKFAIALRNAARSGTVSFERCPLVAEKFAPVGDTEAHQLNCAKASPIPPHGTEWFEMQVKVPQSAPLGPNGLFWRLDPAGDFAPQVVTRVLVSK